MKIHDAALEDSAATLQCPPGVTKISSFVPCQRQQRQREEDFAEEEDIAFVKSINDLLLLQNVPYGWRLVSVLSMLMQCLLLLVILLNYIELNVVVKTESGEIWRFGVPFCSFYTALCTVEELFAIVQAILKARGRRVRTFVACLPNIVTLSTSLLIIMLVIGTATDLLSLISNFVGIQVALQIDELLANVLKFPLKGVNKGFYLTRNLSGILPTTPQERTQLLEHVRIMKLLSAVVLAVLVYWLASRLAWSIADLPPDPFGAGDLQCGAIQSCFHYITISNASSVYNSSWVILPYLPSFDPNGTLRVADGLHWVGNQPVRWDLGFHRPHI